MITKEEEVYLGLYCTQSSSYNACNTGVRGGIPSPLALTSHSHAMCIMTGDKSVSREWGESK